MLDLSQLLAVLHCKGLMCRSRLHSAKTIVWRAPRDSRFPATYHHLNSADHFAKMTGIDVVAEAKKNGESLEALLQASTHGGAGGLPCAVAWCPMPWEDWIASTSRGCPSGACRTY